MVNVALVGTWHVHFNGYANAIARNPDCKITVLWDPDEKIGKEASEKYACDFEPDYDKLLARADVDAVMVCSSTDMHKDLIIKAAQAGKHIFTEKVLCFTKKDALEVADAVKKSGVKFCISYPWRSRGDFLWIKDALDKKLIGEVNYLRMRNAHNGTVAGWLPQTFYDPKTCGGGAMMDLGAHSMYFIHWLMGDPISCASAFTNVRVNSVEDNAVSIFTYPNGAIAVSETAFVAPNNPFELEIVGDKGTILAGGMFDRLCYNIGEGWVYPNLPKRLPEPIEIWMEAMVNGGDIPYTVDDAVALSHMMELAYANQI